MPTAKRIAFVCPRFAEKQTVGGAETLLRAMAERAQAIGHEVFFLTTCARNHFTWQNELEPGARKIGPLKVIFFPVDERPDLAGFLRIQDIISRKGHYDANAEKIWLKNSVNSSALCAYLAQKQHELDAIIIGPYLFGLTFCASRINPSKTLLVPCLHDEGFAYTRAFCGMFRSVAGIMFNAAAECEFARNLYGLPEEKCTVVGMGLDPFEADPDIFARKHGLSQPYVFYAGRREDGKGTPLLLDYMALFLKRTAQDVKLALAGSGTIHPPDDLRARILDTGFLTETEKREAMAGATVFCHPSVNESFGIVILESWLARTPVLVHARCTVNRRHCENSNGGLWFLNYPEFEQALLTILQQKQLRDTMGKAGRAYVMREYAWPAIEQKLQNALRNFLPNHAP